MSHLFSNLRARIAGLTLQRLAGSFVLFALLALAPCCTPPGPNPSPTPTPTPTPAQAHLAVSHGNLLTIVDPDTTQTILDVTRYQEVGRLAYRPDGNRLAVAPCFGNRVVELEPPGYNELSVAVQAASCPWAVGYSPDNQSLGAMIPFRPNPSASLFGHLWIGGPQPLDRDMGLPLRTFAYRPGGGELAVVTPQGLTVLSTGPGYPTVFPALNIPVLSIGYTTDGARLIVGTPTGFGVLNAAAGYTPEPLSPLVPGGVTDIAIAPSGGWVALVQGSTVSIRRAPDLGEVTQLTSSTVFRDADFSSDGSLLAVAEQTGQVRRFRVGTWQEQLPAISISGPINSIAFRPSGFGQRIPVLFVHGHTGNSDEAWFQNANGTSFAAALAVNPQLPIDAFYLELPVHGTANPTRSIADDAGDIQAMIEGGLDAQGHTQVGILNLPAYQSAGRVAIIAYSQGTLSSRYYIKNLMGSRRNGALTVSEFVTLAAPNHGVGDALSCGLAVNRNQPDRARRQLCVGHVSTSFNNCGQCPPGVPLTFTNNMAGDETFITDLNGHPLSDSCVANASFPGEAPSSRPSRADGILYVNLYAVRDELVGDGVQSGDCAGRRLARNLAPDVDNREFNGVPVLRHQNVAHHWEIICTALRTVANHQAPAAGSPCTGLTHP